MLNDSFGVNDKHIDNRLREKVSENFCLVKPYFWLDSDILLWPQDQRGSRDSALRRRRNPPCEAVSWNGSSGSASRQLVWLVTD